jgi:hypothetical protein
MGGQPLQYPPTIAIDAAIDVTQNLDGLAIDAHRGVSIHGSIRFEGTGPPPARGPSLALQLHKVDGSSGNLPWMMPDINARFASVELPPGEYVMRPGGFGAPEGWMLKSAIVNGSLDMADLPLGLGHADPGNVVVTYVPIGTLGQIHGAVRTAAGEPDAEATVLAFSTDRRYWSHNEGTSGKGRTQMVLTSRLGVYDIPRVRAGEYFVIAVPDDTDEYWSLPNSELFERLSRLATRVTVGEGGKVSQDLRTQR